MSIKGNAAFGEVKIRTKKGAKAEKDLAVTSIQLSNQMQKLTPLERQQYIQSINQQRYMSIMIQHLGNEANGDAVPSANDQSDILLVDSTGKHSHVEQYVRHSSR